MMMMTILRGNNTRKAARSNNISSECIFWRDTGNKICAEPCVNASWTPGSVRAPKRTTLCRSCPSLRPLSFSRQWRAPATSRLGNEFLMQYSTESSDHPSYLLKLSLILAEGLDGIVKLPVVGQDFSHVLHVGFFDCCSNMLSLMNINLSDKHLPSQTEHESQINI